VKLVANSDRSLEESIAVVRNTYLEKRYVRITVTTGRDRSLDQNALWFSFYQRISSVFGDDSAADINYWRAFCKLRFGVPILQVHSEEFRNRWYRLVLTNPALQSWEAQMDLMQDTMFGQDGFPVTRLFDTRQGAEYTEAIVRHFTPQGVYFLDLLDGKESNNRQVRR
jgi:hypothetical protein